MGIRNSYRILEVGYGASKEEVKQGYKDLVRVWHPDRFTEDPRLRKKAEEKLKEINRAYADLMAAFSHKTRAAPASTDLHSGHAWWHRYALGMGGYGSRISRDMYERVCHRLNRIELGRIYQVLFNPGNGVGAADVLKDSVKNSPDGRTKHVETDGFQPGMEFSSVFDEVARERRAQIKSEGPPSRR